MKTLRLLPLVLVAGLVTGVNARAAGPATPAAIWVSDTIAITVSGTSTLHDWAVESSSATGALRLGHLVVADAQLTIPTKSLSGGPKGLNGRMYSALNADQHPTLTFVVARVSGTSGALITAVPQTWRVEGDLTVAGTTRRIAFDAMVEETDGRLLITAATELRMTDFGIAPPTFMTVIKTGDAINIRIQWVLKPGAGGAAN